MQLLVPALASLALVAAAACGGGGAMTPDADEALACINSGRGDTYVMGLEHPGKAGQLDFKLMSALPSPPGFNNNIWVVQVNAMAAGVVGAPVTGATVTVTPFMPDHQHGTQIRAVVDELTGGQYQLSPINLWMPGYWEVTIDVQTQTAHDSAIYKFCIQA